MTKTVHIIAAARPNFMKVAPLYHALSADPDFTPVLIHTGQHYDPNMSDDIFRDLGLPAPDHHLGIGSGSHAEQTAGVMVAYEKIALAEQPDWLIVVGDVNPTAACAMVGGKLHIPVVHLEAGLRSRDRAMPEELNRLVTDVLADVLWTPSPDGDENLRAEGIPSERITRVGNIMMDSFEIIRPKLDAENSPAKLGVTPGEYGIVTLHRPSNVDTKASLTRVTEALEAAAERLTLIFPMHPRTKARAEEFGLLGRIEAAGIKVIPPLSYLPFMSLVKDAKVIITDSGGLQEETTYLGIPCLTLRDNTERPITIEQGTNRLVTPESLIGELDQALASDAPAPVRPEYWDGATAGRCVEDLKRRSA
ncbi:UDP-N-acetylglucosamine 2-epimerase (non-hydrolyzing) [Pacificimonas flava]|uniref:UDP-N-acetylglucosamine 2-epimerase (Non-hydrolyzing) n=2 Tax=Pacificimonas TaxID=1960290 RepID=A0A219B962_9SPHN|nr:MULTISPECIES: UDP-N-acetylglucosamine 2-epimerase (non-hydrolyzing) [Pacificimonas]MBZ6378388.1 UDP-N-acetylglucosamine 2-epimerase (non-hydrolyzing) [Pacificimonas aurantium]OWV34308.1 UDP-N-acetylglucosamine 2-epimerase (non-hydrolyzing) [Pacificimonas flava]